MYLKERAKVNSVVNFSSPIIFNYLSSAFKIG